MASLFLFILMECLRCGDRGALSKWFRILNMQHPMPRSTDSEFGAAVEYQRSISDILCVTDARNRLLISLRRNYPRSVFGSHLEE